MLVATKVGGASVGHRHGRVGIAIELGEVAAGHIQPQSVPAGEHVRGGDEVDFDLEDAPGSKNSGSVVDAL